MPDQPIAQQTQDLDSGVEVPIVGQAYKDYSINLNSQVCRNWYLESDSTGKFPVALFPTPGLTVFSAIVGRSVRGLIETNGTVGAVIDSAFYVVNAAGVMKAATGILNTSSGRVQMIANSQGGLPTQIFITDGTMGYVYTIATNILAALNTPLDQQTFLGSDTVALLNDIAIVNTPGLNLFQTSNAADFSTWDGNGQGIAQVASVNTWSEPIVAIGMLKKELWVFTNRGAEIWIPSPNAFPFQVRSDILITQGLAAKNSLVSTNNTFFWLSRNDYGQGIVVQSEYYIPQTISTPAISFAINSYSRVDDAIGYTYTKGGHLFYVLTFPTANKTWVFDANGNTWFEWNTTSYNPLIGNIPMQGRHLSNCFCYAYGKYLVGDYQSGAIYYLDDTNNTDNGTVIMRERTTKHIFQRDKYISIYNFRIHFEQGVGLPTGQGVNPQVMLQVSYDNGHSFGPEMWQSAGVQGFYNYRAVWNRLGRARDWVFKIKTSDPVKWVIVGATATVEVGDL